jgi:hypothetical protein
VTKCIFTYLYYVIHKGALQVKGGSEGGREGGKGREREGEMGREGERERERKGERIPSALSLIPPSTCISPHTFEAPDQF